MVMSGSKRSEKDHSKWTRAELIEELARLLDRVRELQRIAGDGQAKRQPPCAPDIAEKGRAEAALRESEQRFKDFAASASDFFWEMDENLRFSYFSERFSEVTSVAPEYLLGKSRRELMEQDDPVIDQVASLEDWQSHIEDLEAHRPFRGFTHRRVKRNGEVIYLSINGVPRFDGEGRFKGYRGSGNDITERLRAEEALRESEQRFRDFAASASQWFWETDTDLRFTYVSEGYEKATGRSPAFAIGKRREELGEAGPDKERWVRHIADLEAHRPFRDFEYAQRMPDGRDRHFSVNGIPIFDREGRFAGYRGTGIDITDRKLAEEKQRQTSEALAEAQRVAKIGHWRWAPGRGLISCSKEFARIYGVPHEDALRAFSSMEEYLRFVHPEDRDRVAKAVSVSQIGATNFRPEYRIVRTDGEVRHVVEIGEVILDSEGRPAEFRGTVQDITERKLAEEALRQSEERYRRLVEVSPHGIFVNFEGKFALVNPAAVRALGAAGPEELLGREVFDIIHPDLHEAVKKRVVEVVEHGRSVAPMDQVYVGLDGRLISVEATATLIEYQGRPAILSMFSDITDRKRAEEALKKSEARTATAREQLIEAIETISEGFAWYDADDRLILFNSRYRELYADSAGDIVPGARFEDILRRGAEHGQYAIASGNVEEWLRERMALHRNPKGTFYQQLGDGRWLQITERKLPGGGTVGIRTEITRLKEMEDELLRNERLATLGQLTGTVSHELRNPLGAIRTSISAIQRLVADIDRPRLRESVDIVERSISRCDKIIADLLDFTRMPKLMAEPTALDEWLQEGLDAYGLSPAITLRCDLQSRLVVSVDRDRLGRALRNVLDNACQAMMAAEDKRQKILSVAAGLNNGRVEISIEDTGPGIAPEEVGKVFQPLYSTKSFGVGLGMPMVQQILEQHGGGVEIASEPGRGTRLVLWLPR